MSQAITPVQEQMVLPHGVIGRVAGWFMSWTNQSLNQAAIDVLEVGPQDDVLEVGCGPGWALEALGEYTAARRLTGLDPSAVMVAQAESRNARLVESGRLIVRCGYVEQLPFEDRSFSRVFAVSNFAIWSSPADGLREIRRVLRPSGRLVICLRYARPSLFRFHPAVSDAELADDRRLIAEAGFRCVRIARPRRGCACLLGEVNDRETDSAVRAPQKTR